MTTHAPSIRLVSVLILALSSSACVSPSIASEDLPASAHSASIPKQFRERQILVTLASLYEPQWEALTETLGSQYGLQKIGAFPLKSLGILCLVFTVPDTIDLEKTLQKLRKDFRVEHAQLNRRFETLATTRGDRYAGLQHGAQAIRAAQVHRISTGRGVRVAVIDTGIDVSHPDLVGAILRTENFVENGETSFNNDAHGTAVAGVIAARADNGVGIFGVAPEASILGYKSCWYQDAKTARARCSSWTLIKALDQAILDRAQIINLSLAGPDDMLLERLIRRAVAANIVVVAAVHYGADRKPGFPANLDNVVAVDADPNPTQPSLSRTHAQRHILTAPGRDIFTTLPNNHYDFISGSSLATAHVTGVAALLLGHDARLNGAQVRNALTASTSAPALTRVDACDIFTRLLNHKVCMNK